MIDIAKESGVITKRQRDIILNKAKTFGEDLDEIEIILESISPADEDLKQTINNLSHERVVNPLDSGNPIMTDKSSKISRCPNCGAPLQGRVSQCPECGYVFSDVSISADLLNLSKELNEEPSSRRRKRIIENYVTPNTKSELLDYIIFIKPHLLDKEDKNRGSYQKKYLECIDKCKKYFPNNPEIKPFIEEYESIKGRLKKDKRARSFKSVAWKLPLLILLSVGFYEGFHYLQKRHQEDRLNSLEFLTQSLDNNDLKSVRLSLNSMLSNEGINDYSQIASALISHAQDAVSSDELTVADTLISMLYSLPEDSFDKTSVHSLLYDTADNHFNRFEDNAAYETLEYFPTNYPNMLAFLIKKDVELDLLMGDKSRAQKDADMVSLYLSSQPQSVRDEVHKSLIEIINEADKYPSYGYYVNKKDTTVVARVVSGSQVERLGITVGDKIVSRKGCPTTRKDYYKAAEEHWMTTHIIIHDGEEKTFELPVEFFPFEIGQ